MGAKATPTVNWNFTFTGDSGATKTVMTGQLIVSGETATSMVTGSGSISNFGAASGPISLITARTGQYSGYISDYFSTSSPYTGTEWSNSLGFQAANGDTIILAKIGTSYEIYDLNTNITSLGTMTANIAHGAPEIDGSLAPKVGFLLGCLFLMFGRKKQNAELMLTA